MTIFQAYAPRAGSPAVRVHPKRTCIRTCTWTCLAMLLSLGLGLSSAAADVGDYRVVDGGGVYLGNARLFARPCVIQADRVYLAIPEYKEIREKGLTDKDARYHFLMKRASERFLEAVKVTGRDLDVDLIAEVGAVKAARTGAPAISERTDDVISRLR